MRVFTMAAATLIATAILGGCSKESPLGGPGATGQPEGRTADNANVFQLRVPALAIEIEQGQSQEVAISINRGSEFDQDVSLSFEGPSSLIVTPANPAIAAGENQTKVNVQVDPNAPVGAADIEVMGTPQTGSPVSVSMKVDVSERGRLSRRHTFPPL